MATLSVGFDFDTFQTPTRGLFQQQALSLTLASLTAADFVASVDLIKSGDDSSISGAAINNNDPIGQLWIDGRGDIWVQESAGATKTYRYEMGWESRRFFSRPNGETLNPGQTLIMKTLSEFEDFGRSIGESDTSGGILEATANPDLRTNQAYNYAGHLVEDSQSSGFRRWAGRGGMVIRNSQHNTSTFAYENSLKGDTLLATKDNILGDFAKHSISADFDNNQDKFSMYVTAIAPGTSVVSDATFGTNGHQFRVEHFGWGFGPYLRGERFEGT